MKLAREEVCGNSACEHLFFFSLSLCVHIRVHSHAAVTFYL